MTTHAIRAEGLVIATRLEPDVERATVDVERATVAVAFRRRR